ncbi:MAG TPA: Ig-like domain-containing protein [Kofleriaceae bacterium]|nr:Ig-like domain-containing protein [Kofleriaceae bacterium]
MGLSDQVAQVGTELTIDLQGTDADGDRLSYDYRAADLTDLAGHAQVTVSPSGEGVFRWTPLAADIGQHAFDFKVSDGSHTTTVTIDINVKSAIGSQTAPVFRQPLGTGTTIDLSKATCVDLDVVVEDQDTPMVKISQEEPAIEGATLKVVDGQTASWHWCPSRAQEGEDRYTLVLSADDGDNPKTIKNYLVVLRGTGGGQSCPGAAPVITHTPADATTRLDLTPTATVSDDKGIKDMPLFYYSTTNPGATPDLSMMTQVSMSLASGDATSGQYTAVVPNPVASAAAGTQATLYYVIVADDDDDTMGSCDHTTQSQVYSMTVTAGGSTTAGLCEACSADAQCGDGNECVYVGSMGASYCLQGCGGGCAAGYTCSSGNIWSVDGAQAPQCVPESGSCSAPQGSCADDTWEVNDTRSDASANPTLAPDTYDLISCPSTTSDTRANDDWFKIVVAADSRVDLQLAGNGETDLDLHLYHADGTVVTASTSHAADEEINTCLKAATYYVKVNGFGHARSEYLMSYSTTAESCNATCTDDSNEDDDTYSQARATTFPSFSSTGNQICPNDDDWYKVSLYAGETMTVDLTFTQSTSDQDLDLHLYKGSVDQWPCSPADPSTCDVNHGQGASSNEHATFTAPAECSSGCDYDVVVRGWNGSTNAYGITIGIQ